MSSVLIIVGIVIVVAAAAVIYINIPKPSVPEGPTTLVTVRLHDTQEVDLSKVTMDDLPPSMLAMFGITNFALSGTVTINSFSARDVTIKLYNKDYGQWITVVEGYTVTDLTTSNDFSKEIPVGTYEKVSVYFGTIDLDMTHGMINVFVSGVYQGKPFTWGSTVPPGSQNYNGSIPVNKAFEALFGPMKIEDHKTVDVDIGRPFVLYPTSNQKWVLETKSSYSLEARVV